MAEGIAEDVTAALVAKTNQLLVAGHDEPDAQMGPLTTTEQFAKVKAVLEKARAAGLDCITGGNPVHDRRGFFVEPSIYRNVPTDHAVWREEIFGPVLAMRSFTGVNEAVALANDTDFGLAATVVGTDGDAAAAVARRLDAGHIWVNTPQMIFPNTAWGGFKASGIGRELGPWGLAAYRGVKHITSAV
ncbi:acyl-CoA reductase-like NAD-dependent aldehyde dehydrogenase [Rhizobium tibeticum]|nr:acyl-CoA reductase-like NAD-dependent aldehyde dehydrogenase [Rhizobium tibeticum]